MNSYKKVVAPSTINFDTNAFKKINTTEVRWLAGTGFMINSRGIVIMLDPLLLSSKEDNTLSCEVDLEMVLDFPIKAPDVPKLDMLLYTHSDDDHLGEETARILSELSPQIYGPPPVFEKLVRAGIEPELIKICRYGDKLTIDSIEIGVIKADHPWQLQDPQRYGKPFRLADACGYRIKTLDGTILFTGDTRLMEEHLFMECPDVLILDVSKCEYHLNVRGATTLANLMSDALLIPYHYGTYYAPSIPAHCGNPEDVFINVIKRESRERLLAPGQKLTLSNGKEVKA